MESPLTHSTESLVRHFTQLSHIRSQRTIAQSSHLWQFAAYLNRHRTSFDKTPEMELYDQLGTLMDIKEENIQDSSTLATNGDDDDIRILEGLIFSNQETAYNTVDEDTAFKILESMAKTEQENQDQDINIQCDFCEEIFNFESFTSHACLYDKNHKPIKCEPLDESVESEIQKLNLRAINIMKVNQSSLQEMIKRFDESAKSSNHECSKCCRKFVHETGLHRHWDKHIGDIIKLSPEPNSTNLMTVMVCTTCGEAFVKEPEAWLHLQSHHVEVRDKKIKVEKDDTNENIDMESIKSPSIAEEAPSTPTFSFLTKDRPIPDAFTTTKVSVVFQCEFCDAVFTDAKVMLRHVATHIPSSAFECNKCELKKLGFKDILLHRLTECVEFRDERNSLRDFPRVWVCNVCNEYHRGLEQLLYHRHNEHHYFPRIEPVAGELMFVCEHCSIHFNTATKLISHFNEKHLKKPKPDQFPETSERIKQPLCATISRGGSHQTSTRPRQYLCEVCGKSYTQSSHLWQHLRFHQGIKPFGCTVEGCNRRFTIRPDLNDHIRKCHTGERPYLCTICNKRFLTGSVYYQHRLIHRGERRYGCEECGKRFYRADALKNHVRIHTGEKPHSCSECGKKFRQRGDRDKHLKARHPNAIVIPSPRKQRIKSFGRGRIKDNKALYCSMPGEMPVNQPI